MVRKSIANKMSGTQAFRDVMGKSCFCTGKKGIRNRSRLSVCFLKPGAAEWKGSTIVVRTTSTTSTTRREPAMPGPRTAGSEASL